MAGGCSPPWQIVESVYSRMRRKRAWVTPSSFLLRKDGKKMAEIHPLSVIYCYWVETPKAHCPSSFHTSLFAESPELPFSTVSGAFRTSAWCNREAQRTVQCDGTGSNPAADPFHVFTTRLLPDRVCGAEGVASSLKYEPLGSVATVADHRYQPPKRIT